jgi:ASCH domain-containing protein
VFSRPSKKLLALSVWQPWAYLIVTAQKSTELRSWGTNHRGAVVIHASRRIDQAAAEYFGLETVRWPVGVAIGIVQLVDIVTLRRHDLLEQRWLHRSWGPFEHGMRGLVFSSQQVLAEPIEMVGSKGLFPVPSEKVAGITRQLGTSIDSGSAGIAG